MVYSPRACSSSRPQDARQFPTESDTTPAGSHPVGTSFQGQENRHSPHRISMQSNPSRDREGAVSSRQNHSLSLVARMPCASQNQHAPIRAARVSKRTLALES